MFSLPPAAYGKAGQVEEALAVYEDMAARGCERNVITYSSLISACERAGRCDLALRLFLEMQAQGIRPNVVTYNGIIGACGQGEWQECLGAVRRHCVCLHLCCCCPAGLFSWCPASLLRRLL